ncbi:hypothetical protein TNCV_3393221 [Trichonephila clavipes]|nr:hypothetical protein TNCV_3393221 [Trichonephila clavipes]
MICWRGRVFQSLLDKGLMKLEKVNKKAIQKADEMIGACSSYPNCNRKRSMGTIHPITNVADGGLLNSSYLEVVMLT